MLRGFATINYWADDLDAAKRWYAELLGVEPYFERAGPDGRPAYAEFRIGDHQDELGLVDHRWAPSGAAAEPGGAVMYWHVDDVAAAFERLLSIGAREYQPITRRGDQGFVTAAVVDPFGNVLGVMYNPHYLQTLKPPERAARQGARGDLGEADAPADVGFMRALHAALRRDLSRLRDVAAQLDGFAGAPPTVLAGWDAFRAQLDNHHAAEDDDLWPVLRRELSDPSELVPVDAMVAEHRHIPPALAGVDAALRGGGELTAAVERLSTVVLDHLAHEEREVLPLIEQHLTQAQWRAFMHKERDRRSLRERPEFLAWILDGAVDQDAAAVLTEMPLPARLVYRWVLRRRYDAQHRWQIPGPTAEPAPRWSRRRRQR